MSVRIGVISDTHALANLTRKAVDIFVSAGAERIIHCGDIGSAEIVEILSVLPVDYVFGNCDYARRTLTEAIKTFGGTLHDDFGSVEIAGKKIAIYHGQNDLRLEQEIDSGAWNLICTGHTHQSSFEHRGGTYVLNPGAISRRWESPHAALVDLPKMDVTPIVI